MSNTDEYKKVVNFREIAQANIGGVEQDAFEEFAEQFFDVIGFEIKSFADRGADGGRDLIVIEPLTGLIRDGQRRWLVSAKHQAHSGVAVNDGRESGIANRLVKNRAEGFLAFYSTPPTSSLQGTLQALPEGQPPAQYLIFNPARIARHLMTDARLEQVFHNFLPDSYRRFVNQGGYPPDPIAKPPLPLIKYIRFGKPSQPPEMTTKVTPLIEVYGDAVLTGVRCVVSEAKYTVTSENPILSQASTPQIVTPGVPMQLSQFQPELDGSGQTFSMHAIITSEQGSFVQNTTVSTSIYGKPCFVLQHERIERMASMDAQISVLNRRFNGQSTTCQVEVLDEGWAYLRDSDAIKRLT